MIVNMDKIHPVKRDKLLAGLQWLEEQNKKDPVIDKVVVFGSSVRDDCTEESDIDLCFFSKYDAHNRNFFEIYGRLPLIMKDLCDILVYQKIDGKVKQEIDRKGVVVYVNREN